MKWGRFYIANWPQLYKSGIYFIIIRRCIRIIQFSPGYRLFATALLVFYFNKLLRASIREAADFRRRRRHQRKVLFLLSGTALMNISSQLCYSTVLSVDGGLNKCNHCIYFAFCYYNFF